MTGRGIESWTCGLSARERVQEIATALTQPRSVEWIRAQARVSSSQLVTEELERLDEFGWVHTVESDAGTTTYAPNYQRRYLEEVVKLIDSHTREELRDEIEAIEATIEAWKSEFDVESRDALESTLTDSDLTSVYSRDRNKVLRVWERSEADKRLVTHALNLYDDARSLPLE